MRLQGLADVFEHRRHDRFPVDRGRQVAAQVVETVGLHLAVPQDLGPFAGLAHQGADHHPDDEEAEKGQQVLGIGHPKVKRGGTKKKSKASTPRKAVRMAGCRPSREAASTTASR